VSERVGAVKYIQDIAGEKNHPKSSQRGNKLQHTGGKGGGGDHNQFQTSKKNPKKRGLLSLSG